MVSAKPGHRCDITEVAGPFVAVSWQTDLVSENAGVMSSADSGECLAVDELWGWAGRGVVDWVGDEGRCFSGCSSDNLGQLGNLAVEIALSVVGEDIFVID